MRLVFLILFILTFAQTAIAEQNKTTATAQKNPPTENPQSSITDNVEGDLYKILYENSATSNAQIISTIQWSIGIISTFVIVLLGSQILFNYRVNKEEIRAIRSELEEKFFEFKADIISSSNKERKELIDKLEGKLSSNENNFKDTMSMYYTEKDKFVNAKLESFDKDTTRLKSELESKIDYLKIDIEKIDGEVWKIRGVNTNALSCFISSINIRIDKGFDLKHGLDDIIETLESMEDISQDTLSDLVAMLDRVPEKHQAKKLKIKELYSLLPQYIYVDDPTRSGYLKTVNI